jgi:hypothetical protein
VPVGISVGALPLDQGRREDAHAARPAWQHSEFHPHLRGQTPRFRIKRFFGTSENAVKSQIWIAVAVYVLVAIVKKRLNLDASL